VMGLSAEETAKAVGSTAGAVRVAQHRALDQLRNVLASQGDALMTESSGDRTLPRSGSPFHRAPRSEN
jgi:hypothetical protein